MKLINTIILALLPFALAAQRNQPKDAGTAGGNAPFDYPSNFSGDVTVNYVRTIEPTQPVSPNDLSGLRFYGGRTFEKTVYLDGYMRPLQIVIKKHVNTYSKDIVKFFNYDASGQITDDLLPFCKTDRSVSEENKFDKKIESDQVLTYTNLGYVGDNYRFERTVYEQSLLGRTLEKRGAGDSWTGTGKGVKTETRAGLSGDQLRKLSVSYPAGSAPNNLGTHTASEFLVTTITDEDGLTTQSFYDTDGQLVAAEKQGLRTYYVYDVYGRLRYVIPPLAVEQLEGNSWTLTTDILNGLCFKYQYNTKGNQISVKKPGIEPTELRYDVYGRVVFSQDALQRSTGKWVFYKYDMHGRLIQQGIFNGPDNPPIEPEDITPSSLLHELISYVYRTQVCKTSDYQYSLRNTEFMIHYYFDDYDFINDRLTAPNGSYNSTQLEFVGSVGSATEGYNKIMAENPRGLLTGIYTAVSDNSKWIAHVNYYNSDGQLIQTVSDDLENRISVSGMGYDFKGNLTKTVFQNSDATIQKKYTYDCYGRLRRIDHKMGNATAFRRIAQYEYDELGRMKLKLMGAMNYTETYDYNIRGWITGINKKYAAQKTDGFHFGEELCYEKGFEERYYNGRLSGMKWRARGTEDDLRVYGYLYDNKQRLQMADYNQFKDGEWIKNEKDFTSNIDYDANGNIQHMKHMGLDAGHNKIVLDDLTYQYQQNSNKLISVSEGSSSLSTDPMQYDGLGDFRDVAAGTDYNYDANGNLTTDMNRQINTIDNAWFNINKPLKVELANGSTVFYVYDAIGNLLRKRAVWIDMSNKETKTDYVGELTYENNSIALIAHDEGRIRLVPDPTTGLITYEYDYYLKDHLQNIRAIITEVVVQGLETAEAFDPATYNPSSANSEPGPVSYDVDPVGYIATSEPGNAAWETDLFDRVNETRGTRPAGANPNDQYAAVLNAASSRVIGPGKLIKVMAGDQIQLGAEAFFHSGQNPGNPVPINTLASQVIAALSGAAAITGEISNVFSQALINPEAIGMALTDIKSSAPDDTTAPSAYLNYLVFDEGFNIITDASGAIQVQQANAWQNMDVPQFEIAQNGYVYVFTSNQSQSTVSTDNLFIYHWTSVLLEEFHYYPFGLTFEVSQQMNLPGSNSRYNSQSIERNEFTANGGNAKYGLNWYDFMARSYDAQLGRWMQPDPMMQHFSPYLAMSNNPTIFTDPLGLADIADYWYVSNGQWTGVWINGFYGVGDMSADELMSHASSQGGGGGSATGPGGKVNQYLNYSDAVKQRRAGLDWGEAQHKSIENDLSRELNHITGEAKPNVPGLGDPGINGEDVVTLGGTLVAKALIKGGAKVLAAKTLPAIVKAEVTTAKTIATGTHYSVAFEMKLAKGSYPGVYRGAHFLEANKALSSAMAADTRFASAMAELGIAVPRSASGSILGRSPSNWVWHHEVNEGVMQLVPKTQHTIGSPFWNTMHPEGKGGFSIWGK